MNLGRALYDAYEIAQRNKLKLGQRMFAADAGSDEMPAEHIAILQSLQNQAQELEDRLDKEMSTFGTSMPIVNQMTEIRGLGVHLATMVAVSVDIKRCPSVSAMWRFAGYGMIHIATSVATGKEYIFVRPTDQLKAWQPKKKPKDGEPKSEEVVAFDGKTVYDLEQEGLVTTVGPVRERLVKGQSSHFDSRLKSLLFNVASCFMRATSPYKREYDRAKTFYTTRVEEGKATLTKGHIDMRARRRMIKLFLSHLWLRWRELEGLPTSQPYAHAHGGHVHIIAPEEFGWSKTTSKKEG